MGDEPYIGQRLSFSGALCTIRYIGLVQKTKGDWLGVEWDDPNRGKHNGSHDGVKYFDCQCFRSRIKASYSPCLIVSARSEQKPNGSVFHSPVSFSR